MIPAQQTISGQINMNIYVYSIFKNKKNIAKITTAVSAMAVKSGRIGADEVIDDTDGKGAEELEERLNQKEAKTRAILLEMVRKRNLLSVFNWRY